MPLLATFAEMDCISPILLTDAKDNKKSVFLVQFLKDTSLSGSNGGDIKDINTLFRSHVGGDKVFLLSNEKDLIKSFRIGDEEISGNFKRKTYASIDL